MKTRLYAHLHKFNRYAARRFGADFLCAVIIAAYFIGGLINALLLRHIIRIYFGGTYLISKYVSRRINKVCKGLFRKEIKKHRISAVSSEIAETGQSISGESAERTACTAEKSALLQELRYLIKGELNAGKILSAIPKRIENEYRTLKNSLV